MQMRNRIEKVAPLLPPPIRRLKSSSLMPCHPIKRFGLFGYSLRGTLEELSLFLKAELAIGIGRVGAFTGEVMGQMPRLNL
jgi:hypothetical protein